MAIFPCPQCDKKMKAPDDAEGKKLRCPHCETMLVIGEDGLEVFERATTTSRSSRLRDDEDEDDLPIRKRRRDDEDDEDEDDRPRKRRRDDEEDEDEEDRPRKKKKRRRSGGIPAWVWIAAGGGLAAAAGLILLFVFVVGGSKFGKVKEGMSEQEVRDLLGPPFRDTPGDPAFGGPKIAMWTHPPLGQGEQFDPTKTSKVKEILVVFFENGKVKTTQRVTESDARAGKLPIAPPTRRSRF